MKKRIYALTLALTLVFGTVLEVYAGELTKEPEAISFTVSSNAIPEDTAEGTGIEKGSVSDNEIDSMSPEVFEALNDPLYQKYMYKIASLAQVSSYSELTHNSRFDNYHKLEGIDVSKYQGNINWSAVKGDGIDFAIIRLGYRGMQAGTLQMDSYFEQNMRGAYAVGMPIGVYFFTQAITPQEAKEEAEYVIAQLRQYPGYVTYPVIIDIEELSGSRLDNAGLSADERTEICKAFCETIQAAGYTAGVYSNKWYLENLLQASELEQYYIWMAHYNNQTSYAGDYDMWQFSSTGTVKGISGPVDKDIAYIPITPEQVQNLNAKTKTADTITLSWDRLPQISGYRIAKYNENLGKYEVIATTTSTSYKVTGLKAGNKYSFKVQGHLALDGLKKSYGSYSKILSAYTLPARITGTKVTAAATDSITLNWTKQSSVTGYRVYCYNDAGTLLGTQYVTTNSFKYAGLQSGTSYQFKVRSYIDVDGKKEWGNLSSIVKAETKIGKVQDLKVSSASANKIAVKWSALTGADGYRVCLYNETTKKYTIIGNTTKTSYTISNLAAGTEYSIRVAGYTKNGSKNVMGSYCASLKAVTKPGKVTGVKQTAQTVNSFTLSWSAQKGATGYRIYCYDLAGNLLKNINTTNTSYTVTGMDSGKYVCKVRAYKKGEANTAWGDYSETFAANTRPKQVTGLKVSSASTDKIAIKWSALTGADGYRVCLYDETTKKYTILGNTTKTSYTISNLVAGTEYSIRVAGYIKSGSKNVLGSYCSNLKAVTKPGTVTGIKQTAQTVNGFTLSWSAQKGATGYRVYCYDTVGNLLKNINTTNTFYTVTGMDSGKYICKVRAYKKGEVNTAWGDYSSGFAANTRPEQVTGVYRSSVASDRMVVRWSEVKGADGYRVCLYDETTKKYTILGSTTNCYYYIKNLEPKTEYSVRVSAYFTNNKKMTLGVYSKSFISKTK